MMATTKRPRRRLALGVAGVVAAGALGACTGNSPAASSKSSGPSSRTAEPGKAMSDQKIAQLDVGIPGDVSSFDPTQSLGAGGLYVNTLGLESLLRLDSDGKLEPWLATSWEQKSDTVYEYTLRKGVKFWDGTEMTSADVKYSWDQLRDPESRAASYFDSVDSVEAADPYKIVVTLKQPDASWMYTPALFRSVIFQKVFAEKNRAKLGQPGTLLVATGPWKFDSLNPATGVELSAFDDYWGGEPPIEKISAKSFADDNSMALALRAGDIDIAPSVTGPKGFDATAGGGTTTTARTCATALLSLPTQTAPWDDVHVRRAIALAIDRKDIVAATQGRAGGPLETLISPILLQLIGSKADVDTALDSLPTYPHDVEKAKEELKQSKVPDGFSATMTIDSASGSVGQVIAAQLKKVGIDITIDAVGGAEFSALITGPADQRPLTWSETGACSPDPSWDDIFLGSKNLAEGGLNIANWAPPEVDQLLADGLSEQDKTERLTIYTSLLDRLATDVPYVPLYEEGTTYASTTYDIADYGSYWLNSPWLLNLVPK